jgi:protein-disulfide isomerase
MKIVFWPVLNHGDPSLYATITATCVADQSIDAFWRVHKTLFESQGQLWSATRDDYINFAVGAGVDQAQFESCYDGGAGLDVVLELDATRRARGISSQPVFDINDQLLFGTQSLDTFGQVIENALR